MYPYGLIFDTSILFISVNIRKASIDKYEPILKVETDRDWMRGAPICQYDNVRGREKDTQM